MKHETQSVPEASAPVDSGLRCAWSVDPDDDSPSLPPERCTTGKPALFYNCNEHGPVCEEHVCRCRPSLLTARKELAQRAMVERSLEGLRKLGVPEEVLAPVVAYLQLLGIRNGSGERR